MFQVANPIDRFAIGDRDDLVVDDDGSVTLDIQHESPGPDDASNWLLWPESDPTTQSCVSTHFSRWSLWDAGIHRPGSDGDGGGEKETNDAI